VNFSYTVNDAELRATLAKLPTRLLTNVRKRGIRKPLTKVRADLRALWRKAKFRGKAPHRKAIAAATRIDIRRVRGNAIRGKVGVEYGRKGGARARGMQRIYHLLESGFRHKSARQAGLLGAVRGALGIAKRIPGRNISAGYVRNNGKRIYQEISRAILVEARAALKGQTA
jgi:hypothetical protein